MSCMSIRVLIALAALLPAAAQSQDKSSKKVVSNKSTNHGLAVIDVKRVFDKYRGFKNDLNVIKLTIAEYDKKNGIRRAKLDKKKRALKELDKQSPEFKAAQREIVLEESKIKADMTLKRKEILDEEALIYGRAYANVQAACAAYCRKHGIKLLVAFDSSPIDNSSRKSVLKGVNRVVVFQDRIDITNAVLKRLNTKDRKVSSKPRTPVTER